MPVLQYHGRRAFGVTGKRQGPRGVEKLSFRFLPGANEMPNDLFTALSAEPEAGGSKGLQDAMGRGDITMVRAPGVTRAMAAPKKPGKVTAIADEDDDEPLMPPETLNDVDVAAMGAFDAIEFVGGVTDPTKLELYMEQERARPSQRKTVLTAIENALKVANTPLSAE